MCFDCFNIWSHSKTLQLHYLRPLCWNLGLIWHNELSTTRVNLILAFPQTICSLEPCLLCVHYSKKGAPLHQVAEPRVNTVITGWGVGHNLRFEKEIHSPVVQKVCYHEVCTRMLNLQAEYLRENLNSENINKIIFFLKVHFKKIITLN